MSLHLSHSHCGRPSQQHLVGCCTVPTEAARFSVATTCWSDTSNKRRRLSHSVRDQQHATCAHRSLLGARLEQSQPACLQTRALAAEVEADTEESGEWEINWPGQSWEDAEVCTCCVIGCWCLCLAMLLSMQRLHSSAHNHSQATAKELCRCRRQLMCSTSCLQKCGILTLLRYLPKEEMVGKVVLLSGVRSMCQRVCCTQLMTELMPTSCAHN